MPVEEQREHWPDRLFALSRSVVPRTWTEDVRAVVNLIQGRRDLEIISISASFLGQEWINWGTDYVTKDYGVGVESRVSALALLVQIEA